MGATRACLPSGPCHVPAVFRRPFIAVKRRLVGDLIEFQASAGAARGGSGVTAPADEPCLPASLTSLSFSWARLRRLPPGEND